MISKYHRASTLGTIINIERVVQPSRNLSDDRLREMARRFFAVLYIRKIALANTPFLSRPHPIFLARNFATVKNYSDDLLKAQFISRPELEPVWQKVDQQIARYMRGVTAPRGSTEYKKAMAEACEKVFSLYEHAVLDDLEFLVVVTRGFLGRN
jgi:hypothetical protein